MADSFDVELNQIKGRLSQLENNEEEIVIKTAAPEISSGSGKNSYTYNGDKHLELTVDALNRTIETLTHTIEGLALTVEKPVDTLARTIEVLATNTIRSSVREETTTITEPEPKSEPEPKNEPKAETEPKNQSLDTSIQSNLAAHNITAVTPVAQKKPIPQKSISREPVASTSCLICCRNKARQKIVKIVKFVNALISTGSAHDKSCQNSGRKDVANANKSQTKDRFN